MATGTVKWFKDDKGYGFIAPDDGSGNVFVHHSDIVMTGFRTLATGQRVEYDVEEAPKGPQAHNVVPLTTAPGQFPAGFNPACPQCVGRVADGDGNEPCAAHARFDQRR